MRVQARRRGFYENLLRRAGDVITLARPEHFSPRWMIAVSNDTPESRTSAQAALTRESETRSPLGPTRRACESVDPFQDRPVDFDGDSFV